jgi:16S rRNA (cytosine967-C5)-methyltransferase
MTAEVAGPQLPRPDAARRAAFAVVRAVRQGMPWDVAWEKHARRLVPGSLDRRFAQELASGSVRLRARLDHRLRPHSSRSLADLDADVLDILRLGAYQILEMERVPERSAVHATVELAKAVRPRAATFVNAVLRSLLRGGAESAARVLDPVAFLTTVGSHPEWLVRRWVHRFGEDEARALCAYDNGRPQLCLRVNPHRATVAEVLHQVPGSRLGLWTDVVVRCPGVGYAEVRPWVEAGRVSVQDESAVLVALEASPRPGERWLDLAAAPGGKACHLAELVGESGQVLAFDVTPTKVRRIRDNAARLGLAHLLAAEADARRVQAPECDGVLVDAPCSGLGVLSRRPDARWRKRPADLERLPGLQLALLEAGLRHVRPGGVLVYSVCSFEPEETTAIVERFGNAHPEVRLESGAGSAALRIEPGILYFLPQRHGIDGGFVARWRRPA